MGWPGLYNWVPSDSSISPALDANGDPILDSTGTQIYNLSFSNGYWQIAYLPGSSGSGGGSDGNASGATNNGMPPQPMKLQQTVDRAKTCAKAYYGFNTLPGGAQDVTRLALIPAAPIIPKAAVGLPQALGSGPMTNLYSFFSLGSGTAASGANIFRVAGRIGAPIAIASAVIDATAIGVCTFIDQ